MNSKTKIAAAGLGAVAVAAVVGVGISYADDPTPSTSPSASPSAGSTPSAKAGAKPGDHARRGLLKRALHGEVTLGGREQRVVDFQRGTVDRVSDTSITVKSTDGFTASYVVTNDTRVRKDGKAAKVGDIHSGDTVRVVARKNGSTDTARVIAEPKPR